MNGTMVRHTRIQGAIVRGHHILLVQHRKRATGRTYWVIPGGGLEGDESEEDCVVREMREETHLHVRVERLLLDESGSPGGQYQRRWTYLCHPSTSQARPGYEPEPEASDLWLTGGRTESTMTQTGHNTQEDT